MSCAQRSHLGVVASVGIFVHRLATYATTMLARGAGEEDRERRRRVPLAEKVDTPTHRTSPPSRSAASASTCRALYSCLTSTGLCPRREPPRRGRLSVSPACTPVNPRAHHGSGSPSHEGCAARERTWQDPCSRRPQAATVAGARGAVSPAWRTRPAMTYAGGRSVATFPAAPRGAPM